MSGDRREVLKRLVRAGALVLAGPLVPAARAQAQSVKLRVATAAGPGDPLAEMLAVLVPWAERSLPGRLDVEAHTRGSLARDGSEAAALQRGEAEMAIVSMRELAERVPAWSIVAAPYVVRDPEHARRLLASPSGKSLTALARKDLKVRVLAPAYLGTRQVVLREARDIRSPGDLKGLKLRATPTDPPGAMLARGLGMTAVPLGADEIGKAFKAGTIDAAEVSLLTLQRANALDAVKQLVVTSHLIETAWVAIADPVWKKLDESQRLVIGEAVRGALRFNLTNRLREEARLTNQLGSRGVPTATLDLEPVRRAVLQAVAASEPAKNWPRGMLEALTAVR